MSELIDKEIENIKTGLAQSVNELVGIAERIGHKDLESVIREIHERLEDPFMFVIVGEVKAGKSSFINALLGSEKEICKVAPSPMTDTIQQIVYGPEEAIVEISPFLKRISQPVEILKEIAIVDTPGTNTIVDHHQEITENFIPSSDLIVFVFESKNPYRQSAWTFFDFIKDEWRKKIIFILQQKDLMNESDLEINKNGVLEYAKGKGIMEPKVFAVSALMEQNKNPESGFHQVKEYINENITGGKAPYLKMLNNASTAYTINDKIFKGVLLRKEQLESDKRFRANIRETLDDQEQKTNRQVDVLVENLIASYDRITNKYKDKLQEGSKVFSMLKRSIFSKFSSEQSPKEWLEALTQNLEKDLNKEFSSRLQEGVFDIADSIQNMGKLIDAQLKNSETILKDNHEIFSDIAERRANVLKDLQKAFSGFLNSSENFYDTELLAGADEIAPNLAKGGGMAIVGIIITTLTNTMVFDVTGGVLTAIGLLFAGVTIGLNRSKILKGYQAEVNKGRERIQDEVTSKLNNYTSKIKSRIDDNFVRFDRLIQQEESEIEYLTKQHESISSRLDKAKVDLENKLKEKKRP